MADRENPSEKNAGKDAGATKPATSQERKEQFTTLSGLPVERLYTQEDLQEHDPEKEIGYPGESPYTRGIYPSMYRGRFWTMRQYAGFGSATESNQRYRYLLSKGQSGLSVAFDLPTQIGMDSDSPLALGEVGKVGVAIDSIEDMQTLFDGIPLERVSTSMTINSTAAILLCLYVAVAKKQGASLQKLSGTVQNDILKEYIARGTYIYPVRPAMRIVTDVFAWCRTELPKWNTISISGYHIREAGSTAVQEVAFTLANAIAYVQAAIDAGLNVDEFAPQLSFFFNAHSDLLEEIAKYRAARRLWARIMTERFSARDSRSLLLRFHAQTAGSSLTAQQPENNIVRVAFEAMAAVLGGTQSLHTNSMDEVMALPTEKSVEIALRTQQVLAYETNVTNVVDPLGGSYYVEALTQEMELQAESYFAQIAEYGGVIEAIEAGFFQREIAEASYRYQRSIETRDRVIVGVNAFVKEDEAANTDLLKITEETERGQAISVRDLRSKRDGAAVQRSLERLQVACRDPKDNLMPHLIDCANAYATEGEMVEAMASVYGRYTERAVL
jgi:methylmalonyl-CoA mutase N-terminal domain/subunit